MTNLTAKATAIVHGAATIVNAMALGKGAAFGVDLHTKAEVKLTNKPHVFKAQITEDPNESTLLIEKTTTRVLQRFKMENQFGAEIKTWSNIPIAKGLKSSSAAANAVALATTAALEQELESQEIIELGVEAAFDAKVTVTGAYDDACASFYGGIVITNNLTKQILKQMPLTDDLTVLFHIPPEKAYTADVNIIRLQSVKPLVEVAFEQALEGKVWKSLTLNGLIFSSALGFNTSIAIDALAAGALAAGLCGKGPAVTAVVQKEKVDSVQEALQKFGGEVLHANPNNEKARLL